MKLGIVVGTRPNFVKAAAVISALNQRGQKPVLIHTGQHFDAALSDGFFKRLKLPEPDHHLGVKAGSRGEQLGEIVTALSKLLPGLELDDLLVVGDVTSTAAAALAADACDVSCSHIEAGLRSFDVSMPEERNRRIVDAIASRLFVSEPAGIENLEAEGHSPDSMHLVGNVMIDTLLRFRDDARAAKVWQRFSMVQGAYAVATLHRPANVDAPDTLKECLEVLGSVAARMTVLFSAHPRTRARLKEFGLALPERVSLLEPLDYLDFISLMSGARVVLTDSGGAQEETTVLRVPCLTLRDNTERPITVAQGSSRLVGRAKEKVETALDEIFSGRYPLGTEIPLWDGRASERIADIILRGQNHPARR